MAERVRNAAAGVVSIEPFGDGALLVTVGPTAEPRTAARAQAVAAALEATRASEPRLGRCVPAGASVLVPFDPLELELEAAAAIVRGVIARIGPQAALAPDSRPRTVEIAVRYGGPDGPDLEEVAELHRLRPADVVDLHAGAAYHVLFLGFAPGFAYLGGLPESIATPRRSTPRERVPAGSVALAGTQTAVYPLQMPGGWRLIGRTSMTLFDPGRATPALLRPGDEVRFVPDRGS
jgi:inhibitor of KinA